MNKYLCIGDIHTKYELFKSAIQYGYDNGFIIIAVGDYVDSHDTDSSDNIKQATAKRNQIKCLELARKLNEDGHHALLGNHEFHYVYEDHRYSGYQADMAPVLMHKIKDANLKPFKFIYPKHGDPILVTHAGISKKFVDQVWGLDQDEVDVRKLELDLYQQAQSYSSAVYGYSDVVHTSDPYDLGTRIHAGIIWNRPDAFEPIENARQVFGHSNTTWAHFSGNSKVAGIYNFEGRKKDLPNARNFNIDNIEFGLGELLTYNEETDRFGVVTKDEYHSG